MFTKLKSLITKPYQTISVDELDHRLRANKGLQLIDVRTPSEYAGGHIKGARNIPLDQIQAFKGPKGKDVYLICQSGMRSRRAAGLLAKKGYSVINTNGGMMAWKGKTIGGN